MGGILEGGRTALNVLGSGVSSSVVSSSSAVPSSPSSFSFLKSKLEVWKRDAIRFVREVIGVEPTEQQKQLLNAIVSNNAIAVRSGHGTGKSASLSWLVLWFLLTRPNAKVICTAPTRRQLFDVLWAEISLWVKKARLKLMLDELLSIQSEVIRVGDRKDWFARAVAINVQSSAEEQAEALAGYHAKHLLCIIDEASGIPDPVFRPIEGYMTGEDNKVVLAGNPTRTEGYFWRVFNDGAFGDGFVRLHWSSVDSPLVSRDWIERMKLRYGEGSTEFRVRVLGEFPVVGEMELVPREWIDRACYVELPEIAYQSEPVIGIDVARFGVDETAVVERRGAFVTGVWTKSGMDTIEIVDWVIELLSDRELPKAILVDVSGGLGAGVADLLRRRFGPVVLDVNVGVHSFDRERFVLLRDELWWKLREAFEAGQLYIPAGHEKLKRQIMSVTYQIDGRQRIRIVSKAELKKKGLPSPDCADALCLTFYLEPYVGVGAGDSAYRAQSRTKYALSWRVV